jgi:Kef-type K+ transport system membrane component KefB
VHEQHAFPFLREILLFLTLAGILIPLLQRLRINQVLGFLAAGRWPGHSAWAGGAVERDAFSATLARAADHLAEPPKPL